MGVTGPNDPLLGETTCGSLLQQLQVLSQIQNNLIFKYLNAYFLIFKLIIAEA